MSGIVTGLLGWPVEHSLSPAIHGYWLDRYGIDGSYELFPAEPESLAERIDALRARQVKGFNVTVPHKETIIPQLEAIDQVARRIGAVNTVLRVDGNLLGTNTDAYGFITSLREGAGELAPYLPRVVVIGAGGAARAALVALKDAGAGSITIVNRTEARAKKLAEEFGAQAMPWANRASALKGASLLVNTSSLGMQGKEKLDLPLGALPAGALVHDIVYAPLDTALLKEARARGNRTVDGLGMLLHQAAASFRIWHGIDPEVTPQLRARLTP